MDNLSPAAFKIKTAAEMMERDVLSQSVNNGMRKHQHLDWLELSISAATAGFMGGTYGQNLNKGLDKTFKKVAPTISSELQSLATGAATAAATNTHFDAAQILINNLGNAIGNNLVNELSTLGTEKVAESAIEAAKKEMEKEKPQTLAELLQFSADTRAEQSRGAWKDDAFDDLTYTSDLFQPWEEDSNNPSFDNRTFWKGRQKDNSFLNSPLASSGLLEDGYGDLYGSKTLGMINNVPMSSGEGALGIRNNGIGQYDIDYDALLVKKPGAAYRKNKIVSNSYYSESPGSPIWGDASKELQIESIDALITASIKHGLNARDTAYVLAITHVESGFNPNAAAGITTATGLGQFIDDTGLGYGLNNSNRWEVSAQADALVRHFIDNKALANKRNLPEQYIYKYHHDGPTRDYGGLALSNKKIIPKLGDITNAIRKIY